MCAQDRHTGQFLPPTPKVETNLREDMEAIFKGNFLVWHGGRINRRQLLWKGGYLPLLVLAPPHTRGLQATKGQVVAESAGAGERKARIFIVVSE